MRNLPTRLRSAGRTDRTRISICPVQNSQPTLARPLTNHKPIFSHFLQTEARKSYRWRQPPFQVCHSCRRICGLLPSPEALPSPEVLPSPEAEEKLQNGAEPEKWVCDAGPPTLRSQRRHHRRNRLRRPRRPPQVAAEGTPARAGDSLKLETIGDQITLRPEREGPRLVKEHGFWVIQGTGDSIPASLPSDLRDQIYRERKDAFLNPVG